MEKYSDYKKLKKDTSEERNEDEEEAIRHCCWHVGRNLEIDERYSWGAAGNVSAANERGDTPLLAARRGRRGEIRMFESLLSRLAHIKAVRRDGASALTLSIISSKARILNRMEMPGLEIVSLTERKHETDGTKSCI